jgi:hypothetical protein
MKERATDSNTAPELTQNYGQLMIITKNREYKLHFVLHTV